MPRDLLQRARDEHNYGGVGNTGDTPLNSWPGYEEIHLDSLSAEFYGAVNRISSDLESAQNKLDRDIPGVEQQLQRAFSESDKQQLRQQRDSIVNDIKHILQSSKAKIGQLNSDASNDKSIEKRERKNRVNRCTAVMGKIRDLTKTLRLAEKNYQDWTKQQIVKQFRVVEPGMSEQEVHQAIDNGQAGNIFSQAVLHSNRMGEANRVLRDVQDRHRDLQQLEQTILQLAELFNEMSTMVNNQQEIINNIEAHVDDAVVNMEKGGGLLTKAIQSAKAARHKRKILAVIIFIILVIIGIAIWRAICSGSESKCK